VSKNPILLKKRCQAFATRGSGQWTLQTPRTLDPFRFMLIAVAGWMNQRSEGKEGLFEDVRRAVLYQPRYSRQAIPYFYLVRLRLMREVRYASIGYPERADAKWLILHYVWWRLAPVLRARASMMFFVKACEGKLALLNALWEANNAAFRAALGLYRQERGRGERATDVSTFFRQKNLPIRRPCSFNMRWP
jgi:hypothetical protein